MPLTNAHNDSQFFVCFKEEEVQQKHWLLLLPSVAKAESLLAEDLDNRHQL
jgi:hypothetical protein